MPRNRNNPKGNRYKLEKQQKCERQSHERGNQKAPGRGNHEDPGDDKAKDESQRKAGTKDEDKKNNGMFSLQLLELDLKLRKVLGDGNCLFRALSDQLEGHSGRHLELRQETVHYMTTHRQDFEPFLAKDEPFTTYLSKLSESGTFAGHEAIVAFARNQQMKVVIHQLRAPLWEIDGTEKQLCKELHIAFRYGNHYDSVRRIGDNSESPAQLRIDALVQSVTAGQPYPGRSVFASEFAYRKPKPDDFHRTMSKKSRRKKHHHEQELQNAISLSRHAYSQTLPEDTVTTLQTLLTTLSI